MAELFKNIFNKKFVNKLSSILQELVPDFNASSFSKFIFDKEWEEKELKERMRHVSIALKNHLSDNFKSNADILLRIIEHLQKKKDEGGFEYIFMPDFIELYGLEDYKTSIAAFEKTTPFISCEFAVRPFIIKYEKKMMQQMLKWSKHKHPMVRRLATEGCRPRLPWAMAIPALKKDPNLVLPILENLKNDPSESVRRSVANNLNDISKDHPDLVLQLAKKWQGKSKETDRLVKHACRTLLKQGTPEVMELFGFGAVKKIKIDQFKILTPKVKIGNYLEFTFDLVNADKTPSLLRLEYGLYYLKANKSLSKKVFKISEKVYPEKSTTTISRKQSFRVITTRVFHPGKHQVSIIINGQEFQKLDFELIK